MRPIGEVFSGSEASQPHAPLANSPQGWVMHRCGSPSCVMPISIPECEQRETPPLLLLLPPSPTKQKCADAEKPIGISSLLSIAGRGGRVTALKRSRLSIISWRWAASVKADLWRAGGALQRRRGAAAGGDGPMPFPTTARGSGDKHVARCSISIG